MDLSEAAEPVRSFRSLDDMFVRHLEPGARSWPGDPATPASPVDGIVGQRGEILEGRLLQAKGRGYTAADLLDDDALADRFEGGTFITLYLAPRHYHRIHAPVTGSVARARHIPGRLLPVNTPAVRMVDQLFPRNERLSVLIDGEAGGVAVVAVGAFNVGRITADFDASLVTNRRGARAETRIYHPAVEVERGDPLMAFHLGSTVVLLFERRLEVDPALEPGRDVRLGAGLGRPYLPEP